MKLLLDTHVVIWWLSAPERMSSKTLKAITASETQVYLSAAVTWEMAIKASLGRLELPKSPMALSRELIYAHGFLPLYIEHDHAARAAGLPQIHQDPFDRLLIAQAQSEKFTLVTADAKMKQYDVKIMKP